MSSMSTGGQYCWTNSATCWKCSDTRESYGHFMAFRHLLTGKPDLVHQHSGTVPEISVHWFLKELFLFVTFHDVSCFQQKLDLGNYLPQKSSSRIDCLTSPCDVGNQRTASATRHHLADTERWNWPYFTLGWLIYLVIYHDSWVPCLIGLVNSNGYFFMELDDSLSFVIMLP